MFNKRTLLASSALAVMASVSQAQAGDFYISIAGGANWLANDKSGFTSSSGSFTSYHQNSETGFALSGAIGVHLDQWVHGLRAEVEAGYRRNKEKGRWAATTFSSGFSSGVINAHESKFSVMANVWYDIDLGRKWTPYLGGGIGWARTKVDGAFSPTFTSSGGAGAFTSFSREESGFAWQLGAGLNYEIQDGVRLGVGYRYFRGPDVKNKVFVGFLPVTFDHDDHTVQLELSIDTN
ncbi:MAG: outer membrane beta-barrel protein [Alphaproteobacteria bacterium]|nr:outer membrane beta-barrel protein [Alphaproteobacteria bacterium]